MSNFKQKQALHHQASHDLFLATATKSLFLAGANHESIAAKSLFPHDFAVDFCLFLYYLFAVNREKNMPTARAQIDFDSIENRPRRVTPKVIRAVCGRIIEKVRPEKIVLLGSHAKGVATKDSDLDLLVIIDSANSLASLTRRDRYGEILRLFRHRGFGKPSMN